MATAATTGPISLARKSEIREEAVAMSCPFAGHDPDQVQRVPTVSIGRVVGPPGLLSTRAARTA